MALHHKVIKVMLEGATYAGTWLSILCIGVPMFFLAIAWNVAGDAVKLGGVLYDKLKKY